MEKAELVEKWLATAAAALSVAFLSVSLLYLAGRPLATDDLWWHLSLGRAFAAQGPWPGSDPTLFTAREDAPQTQEWLFDVAVDGIRRAFGFQGLRVFHVVWLVAILGFALSLFRRQSRSQIGCLCALAAFVVLSWYRLFQFRPDLFSIPASFLLYRLLLEPGTVPTWGRVAGSVVLLFVWANAHGLFVLGPLLLVTGLMALALRALLERWAAARGAPLPMVSSSAATARRMGLALVLGLAATFANPKGGHHLLFFSTAANLPERMIADELRPFDPFAFTGGGSGFSPLAWIAIEVLLVGFLATAGWALWRFLRAPSAQSLRVFDPILFGLGGAAFAAVFTAIRLSWLLVFPLLFLLRTWELAEVEPRWARPRLVRLSLAAAALALAMAAPEWGGLKARMAGLPRSLRAYLSSPYESSKYYVGGVSFLSRVGATGRVFNSYNTGGFLGYWLSPRLTFFIDGRTLDYPPEVFAEAFAIEDQVGVRDGESFLDILERRSVDWFFGQGFPRPADRTYTTAHLDRAPGWIPVSRSIRHAIYLRNHPRNRANLKRVVAYYERQGVPFDPAQGLNASEVIRERPRWAVQNFLLPPRHAALLAERSSADPAIRYRALDTLAWTYLLIGAYADQVEADLECVAIQPAAPAPRRRLAFGLLKLGRREEARTQVAELLRLTPSDPRARLFARAAGLARAGSRPAAAPGPVAPVHPLVNRLPVLAAGERRRFLARFGQPPGAGAPRFPGRSGPRAEPPT